MSGLQGTADSRRCAGHGHWDKLPACCARTSGDHLPFHRVDKQLFSNDRLAAFVGEVSNLSSHLARICNGLALIDEDPETREFFIGVMTAANLTTAGTQLLEAGADA